ncbi:MAG: DUF4358 domain-containing protein [Clostridiales bacterium]|jgi:hypothetical protein|nr:DUF4358 domain-containing protein [Clostridiales bacterium]
MKLKSLLFLLAACCLLTSCVKSATQYKDDVPVTQLVEAADARLETDALADMTESYVKGAMKMDPALFAEYVVKVNAAGANIDEYGIFKAKDASSLKAVEEEIKDYLQMRKDTWMEEYMPLEKPKLVSAEIKTMGLYVMYAILSNDSRAVVFKEIESHLAK